MPSGLTPPFRCLSALGAGMERSRRREAAAGRREPLPKVPQSTARPRTELRAVSSEGRHASGAAHAQSFSDGAAVFAAGEGCGRAGGGVEVAHLDARPAEGPATPPRPPVTE